MTHTKEGQIMRKVCVLLVMACGLLVLDARAEVCPTHLQFTISKDSGTNVPLGIESSQFAGPGSGDSRFSKRFIFEGRAIGNDISCTFKVSFQAYCLDYDHMAQDVILSEWKVIGQARDGGHNQCVWDGAWRIEGLDSLTIPPECQGIASVRLKYEANVKNKGKLQVVNIFSGEKGCGKP